ncbi:Alpha/Beta hydrolase protein [Mycena olivaceomarginata]|nr:Alpha/Beta hydrolase protein [Mycena olivaceomarginata]
MRQVLLLAALALTTAFGAQPFVTIKNGTVLNGSFGTLDATSFGPHCWSSFTTGFDSNTGYNNSEDCLTLNVIRPDGASETSPVPVNVWIYGGGLTEGGAGDSRYNGSFLVQSSVANGKPIVFVSINYRLGSLGFLGGKALKNEGSTNMGLRDQRLALHWVQENIAKFGGDPTKVTIHGQRCEESLSNKIPIKPSDYSSRLQSAGANSVHAHIIAYGGRDDKLFHQAIPESGTGGTYDLTVSGVFQTTYDALLINTSCSSTNSVGPTAISRDGDIIDTPSSFESYRTDKWVKVAFLTGSNTDEGRTFAVLGANTTVEAKSALAPLIPADSLDDLLALYPDVPSLGCPYDTGDFQLDPIQNGIFATPGSQNKRISAITGDIREVAGPRWLGRNVSSQVPFYKYRFNHKPYTITFGVEDFIGHFAEVAYAFNLQTDDTDFWATNHYMATPLGPGSPIEDRFLGVYMSRSWASFIATGDPNNANVPTKIHWPKYSDGQKIWSG